MTTINILGVNYTELSEEDLLFEHTSPWSVAPKLAIDPVSFRPMVLLRKGDQYYFTFLQPAKKTKTTTYLDQGDWNPQI